MTRTHALSLSRSDRSAFTLVELLVAMALILFVMSILASAFSVVGKTFSDLKAIGDMNEKLRTVSRLLRAELGAVHLESDTSPYGTPLPGKVSNLWWNGPSDRGFFRVWQQAGTPPGAANFEGLDADNIDSFRTNGSALHFTVMLPAQRTTEVFQASV